MFEVMFQHQNVSKILMITGATLGFLFGGWSELMSALLILQGLDVVLGIMNAGKRRELSSRAMLIGLERKVGIWLSLILAHVIDSIIFNGQPVAMTGLSFSFIGYEGLSIVENLALINVPLPNWMTKLLIQVQTMHNKKMDATVEGLNPETIEKVIIKTQDGREKVMHDDKKTMDYYENVLRDDSD